MLRSHDPGELTSKGDRDFASEVDYLVEQRLRDYLADKTPHIDFIGEEAGTDISDAELWWALDPIDGTVNFAHAVPLCGVSLGLIRDGRPIVGVIDFPFLQNRYYATEGEGAFCNERRLQASTTKHLSDALITIGDYAVGDRADEKNRQRLHLTRLLASEALRIRMLGSPALDLAWLAEGKTDASITLSNHAWDVAADVIIAREAGAKVFDIDSTDHHTTNSTATIATGPNLAQPVAELVATVTAHQLPAPTDR